MNEVNDISQQKPIVGGSTGIRKKTTGEKIKDAFKSEDSQSIVDYLIFDVAIPALKKTVVDMFTNGINMLFYGGNFRPGNNGYYSSGVTPRQPYYSYGSNYAPKQYGTPNNSQPYYGEELRVDDYKRLYWRSQQAAMDALEELRRDLAMYQVVRVDKLFDIWARDRENVQGRGNIRCPYTAAHWGWTNLMDAGIYPGSNEYGESVWYLRLPREMQIG